MNCPKYIKKLIYDRAKYAEKFVIYDTKIANWLEKHDIEVYPEDIHLGCESICNPIDSSNRVYQAIINKE